MLELRRRLARLRVRGGAASLGPRIAVLGTFDVADFGSLVRLRVLERELRTRLHEADVTAYAPLGHEHPVPIDGGHPALPLGPPEQATKRLLAERHDLVVITGDVVHTRDERYARLYHLPDPEEQRLRPSEFFVDGLGPELEDRCPVAWSAVGVPFDLGPAEAERVRAALDVRRHVSVADESSYRRLLATGSARDVPVVPDPAILVSRLFPQELLGRRLAYLRALGGYPAKGWPVLVEADASLVPRAGAVAEEVRQRSGGAAGVVVAVLDASRGDAALADAVAPLLDAPAHLPADLGIEDLVAAIAHAAAFVGSSPAGLATARAFGVPAFAAGESSAETPFGGGDETRRVDAELDHLAAIAESSWSQRAARDGRTPAALSAELAHARERYDVLLAAHEARGERLVRERLQFADIVERLQDWGGEITPAAAQRIAELENAIFTAEAAASEARFELDELRRREPHDG